MKSAQVLQSGVVLLLPSTLERIAEKPRVCRIDGDNRAVHDGFKAEERCAQRLDYRGHGARRVRGDGDAAASLVVLGHSRKTAQQSIPPSLGSWYTDVTNRLHCYRFLRAVVLPVIAFALFVEYFVSEGDRVFATHVCIENSALVDVCCFWRHVFVNHLPAFAPMPPRGAWGV